MDKRNAFLLFSLLYVLNAFIFSRGILDYKSFVWFAFASNFIIGAISIVVLFILSFIPLNDDSIKNALKSALSTIPLVLFHLVAATFLSFLAYWDGFSLMTNNKTLRSEIPWSDVYTLIAQYWPYYFPYLLTKLILFKTPKSKIYGGFVHVRDAVILIVTNFAIPLMILKLSETFPLDRNSASFYGISFFLFIPWSLLFSRDVFEHKEDKVYLFKATTQFPVKVTEQGPQGWGLLFTIFGLVFAAISTIGFTGKFATHWYVPLIFFPPFFIVGSIFFIIGLNIQWGFKNVTITQNEVTGHSRVYLPWPKNIHWQQSLNDYQPPVKDTRYHARSDDTAAYYTYEVKLNLKVQKPKKKLSLEPDRNVTLYRAYHEDHLDQELAVYHQLFAFMEKKI